MADAKNKLPVNKATGKVYLANFYGDEIDGKRYKIGEAIDAGVDAGTVRFLTSNGRLTELDPGDEPVTSGGEGRAAPPTPVTDMSRIQLLIEAAGDVPDEELRRMVTAKREAAEAEHEDEGAPELSEAEKAEVQALVDGNNRDGLIAKAPKDAEIKGDTNKTEIATMIVLAKRSAA